MRLAPLHVPTVHAPVSPQATQGSVDLGGMAVGALVALGVLLLGLALAALVVVLVSRAWLRRAARRVVVRPPATGAGSVSAQLTPVVAAADLLHDAVTSTVETAPEGLLLVAREEDVLPSAAQLRGAAHALGDGRTGFVTFADLDTDGAAVRADRQVVLAAPGPLAVRSDAVTDAGGWSDEAASPEVELSARMLRRGWHGLALGQTLGTVCDPVARERQTSWTVLRRHPGLLLPGVRHADNELHVGERLALLATTASGVAALPSPAERARVRSASARVLAPVLAAAVGAGARLRPRAPRWRRPAVLTTAGVALAVLATAGLVAVTGTLDGAAGPGRPAAAATIPDLDRTAASTLPGRRLEPVAEANGRPAPDRPRARQLHAAGPGRGHAGRAVTHRRSHATTSRAAGRAGASHRAAQAPASPRPARPVHRAVRPAPRPVVRPAAPAPSRPRHAAAPAPRPAPAPGPRHASAPRSHGKPAVRNPKAAPKASKPGHGHGGR